MMVNRQAEPINGKRADFHGTPDLQYIERLAQQLLQTRNIENESLAVELEIPEGQMEVLAKQLCLLKIGPLTFELPREVRAVVGEIEDEWASATTLNVLREKLNVFIEPLRQEERQRKSSLQELELERERMETLNLLVNLLDELLESQSDALAVEASRQPE